MNESVNESEYGENGIYKCKGEAITNNPRTSISS